MVGSGRAALAGAQALLLVVAWSSGAFATAAAGPELRVAVAASFTPVLRRLCDDYHATRPGRCVVSSGASGLLATQVMQGAPFDLFLSADSARPERLVASGHAVAGTLRTYAIGRLVLWAPGLAGDGTLERTLANPSIRTLSIADPDAAPYGAAALEVLRALKLPRDGRPRIVRGANVAQALQFVESGAADAGFVARAQMVEYAATLGSSPGGRVVDVPAALHAPIEQQAVLLARAADDSDAREFIDYLGSAEAQRVIEAAGYALPPR
jgi:molybdate transport system substrate-binding protein